MKHDRCLKIIEVGEGLLFAVTWSPDGARLAVGDENHGASVWTAEGKMIWRNVEHTDHVWSVAWSPDGRRIASGSDDHTMRIWNAETGEALLHCKKGITVVFALCWSPDSQKIAWNSNYSILQITDPNTGDSILECSGHTGTISCVTWSIDGKWMATGSEDKTIRLWNAETGKCLKIFKGHQKEVWGIYFSPDGQHLASASWDNTVRIWDVNSGKCRFVCKGHGATAWSVSWSPECNVIASGSTDNTIRLWSKETGLELACFQEHSNSVLSVAFSPEGARLASASEGGALRIWDVSDFLPKRQTTIKQTETEAYITRQAATVGRRAVFASPKPLWVPKLEGADGDCLGVLRGISKGKNINNWKITSLALLPDSRLLISGSPDGKVRGWDLNTGTEEWEGNERHDDLVRDIAVSPGGKHIASGSDDKTVRIWDALTGDCIVHCEGHRGQISKVTWSWDSKFLASSSWDDTIRIWEGKTGKCLHHLKKHEENVLWVEWSPDGRFLASGSSDKSIIIWDGATGRLLRQLEVSKEWINTVTWSPDGRIMASCGHDKIRLWDTETWEQIRNWAAYLIINYFGCLHWSPDGCYLAAGAYDKGDGIYIWEAATGRQAACFNVEGEAVNDVWRIAWSPNGAFLAASYMGDIFRLWNIRQFAQPRTTASNPEKNGPLPSPLAPLPPAFYQLHRLSLHPPLSLLRDLLRLIGGSKPESLPDAIKALPGVRAFSKLRWPASARIGLAALLLQSLPLEDWHPPEELTPTEMREHLKTALAGDSIPAKPASISASALQKAVDEIDERMITILTLLGPEAVATDPGLPLHLAPQLPNLPRLSKIQRRLLGLRLRLDRGTRAQGSGIGVEHAGIVLQGDLRNLLTSQLGLPQNLFLTRLTRGELLYRARIGQEPPRLRPTVILLDVTPPCFGPIESVTKPAAHIIADALYRAGLPAVLITTGEPVAVSILEQPADFLEIWTRRDYSSADPARAFAAASAMRETLRNGPVEPVVVLLTHPWFAEGDGAPPVPGLRALFVQYPGRRVAPPFGKHCERFESLLLGEVERLPDILGRLVA